MESSGTLTESPAHGDREVAVEAPRGRWLRRVFGRSGAVGRRHEDEDEDAGPRPPATHLLLLLVAVVPALAVLWRREGGEVVLALYRQPKLAAFDVLAWTLLAVAAFRLGRAPRLAELWPTLARWPVLWLAAFSSWIAITGFWGVVPENHWHELRQFTLGSVLLVTLLAWARHDPRLVPTVTSGLVAAMAIVTGLGFVQMLGPIPLLPPVQPSMGVEFPSLMGYKNPAALAVVGQIFLLAGLAVGAGRRRLGRWLLWALVAAELVYLARLQSRTAILALAAGATYWLVVTLRSPHARARAVQIAGVALATVLLVVAADRDARARFGSALRLAASPTSLLDSDRGTYVLNSIQMASCRPFGVGLGDWQTAYPLFRAHDRYRSFDEVSQVRRAHSDYAQILGEAGWLGLVLWVGFLASAVWTASRRAFASGDAMAGARAAQLVALCAAMATDYLLDLPFHRQLLFLVAFVALYEPGASATPKTEASRWRFAFPVLVLAIAVLHSGYSLSSLRRSSESALVTRNYLRALSADDPARRQRELVSAVERSRRVGSLLGYEKTSFRDLLVFAHSRLLLGDREGARVLAERSLELHPYNPPAFLLMSELETDPRHAAEWRQGHQYILHQATCGYLAPYPLGRRPRGTLGP